MKLHVNTEYPLLTSFNLNKAGNESFSVSKKPGALSNSHHRAKQYTIDYEFPLTRDTLLSACTCATTAPARADSAVYTALGSGTPAHRRNSSRCPMLLQFSCSLTFTMCEHTASTSAWLSPAPLPLSKRPSLTSAHVDMPYCRRTKCDIKPAWQSRAQADQYDMCKG